MIQEVVVAVEDGIEGVSEGGIVGVTEGDTRCLSETTVCLSSTASPQTVTMIIKYLQDTERSETEKK